MSEGGRGSRDDDVVGGELRIDQDVAIRIGGSVRRLRVAHTERGCRKSRADDDPPLGGLGKPARSEQPRVDRWLRAAVNAPVCPSPGWGRTWCWSVHGPSRYAAGPRWDRDLVARDRGVVDRLTEELGAQLSFQHTSAAGSVLLIVLPSTMVPLSSMRTALSDREECVVAQDVVLFA